MMAIGNYFAFIIIVMGTLLAAHDFSNKDKRQFSQDMLNAHNSYREIHGSAELTLSNKMCKTAKKILKKWIKNPNFLTIPTEYRANYEYILREIDDKFLPDANKILGNWYKNEAAYDYFEEILPTKETDKFTQIVWKSTKEIGVGIIRKDKEIVVLVIYSPAGNQKGQYMSNVLNPRELTWEKVELDDYEKKKFIQDILIAHNSYRENHDSPKLVLDEKLNEVADKRVKEWKAFRPNTLHDEYGVNYFQVPFECKSKLDPKRMVSLWYRNETYYDYIKEPSSPKWTDSFTQVVWKSTQTIGVGILIINRIVNVVVIYSPAGNQPGQYISNVNCVQETELQDRQPKDV